ELRINILRKRKTVYLWGKLQNISGFFKEGKIIKCQMHQWPTMKIELCIFSFQAISILKISGVIRILCMIRGSGGTLTIISDVRDEIAASKMLSLGSLKACNLYNCPPREQIANEIHHAFAITVT